MKKFNWKKVIGLVCFVGFVFCMLMANNAFADPRLMWNASTGDVGGYAIYHGLTNGGDYPTKTDVGDVTEYPLDGLITMTEGTTYYFVVRAYNASGESGNSNQADWTVPIITPNPPSGLTYFEGELNWTAPENDFDSYRIYYTINVTTENPGGENGMIPVAGDQTSVATPEMQCGSTGHYYIVSVWGDVESPQSDLLTIKMNPCAPTELRVIEIEPVPPVTE